MSLQLAAQNLASRGRGDDSMLVHMTPREVKGLQALAMSQGGSLTINPDTGLPEAGFLDNLLPTIIGAGLTFFSGGTLNPMTIGMLTGGFEAVRTGDLGKGILAGLGAYGGAGIGNALAATGTQTAQNAAMMDAVKQQAAGTAGTAGSQIGAGTIGTGSIDLAGAANMVPQIGSDAGAQAILQAQQGAAAKLAEQGAMNQFTSGLSASAQNPGMFASNLGAQFPTMTEKMAASAPTLLAATAPPPMAMPGPADEKSNYAGPYYPTERELRRPGARQGDSSEFEFFTPSNPMPGFQPNPYTMFAAEGGMMTSNGVTFDDSLGQESYAPGGFSMKDGSFVMSAREVAEVGNGSSNAGLERLAKMGAQPIRGKGDGVSDSIKANIGGTQEARVARDEAYFPPEAVKRIGKGSPKKGAKKLYALMSAAEKARKKAPRGEDSGLRALLA